MWAARSVPATQDKSNYHTENQTKKSKIFLDNILVKVVHNINSAWRQFSVERWKWLVFFPVIPPFALQSLKPFFW